jgi:bifunctional non-homologous end joining protein LigD
MPGGPGVIGGAYNGVNTTGLSGGPSRALRAKGQAAVPVQLNQMCGEDSKEDAETVRLFTRRGYDWTDRYPAIAAAPGKLRAKSFTLDGEAVVAGPDGVAVFDALHRRGRVADAILQAFDLLELDGEDLRPLPLGKRKDRLARLLARVRVGIALNQHTDDNGAVVFLHACKMGLEGIVSKRLTAPYRSGPSRDWLKVKNPDSPAMIRAREHFARLGR